MSGSDQRDGVALNFFGDRDLSSQSGHFQNTSPTEYGSHCWLTGAGGAVKDCLKIRRLRISNQQFGEKSVELGFGEWVCAFHFEGVLGGHDKERLGQTVRRTGDGHGVFLHGFEKCRLRLGGRAVDFVGQQNVGEQRAFLKIKDPATIGRFGKHLRSNQVSGHQIGSKLNAPEIQLQSTGEGTDGERFTKPRDTFKQYVSATDQSNQSIIQNIRLTHDDS